MYDIWVLSKTKVLRALFIAKSLSVFLCVSEDLFPVVLFALFTVCPLVFFEVITTREKTMAWGLYVEIRPILLTCLEQSAANHILCNIVVGIDSLTIRVASHRLRTIWPHPLFELT